MVGVASMARCEFLSKSEMEDVHSAAIRLLQKTGVLIQSSSTENLLESRGCGTENGRVFIPEAVVEQTLETVPSLFNLYGVGEMVPLAVGGDNVVFNPGSTAPKVLDRFTGAIRKATRSDLREIACLVESLSGLQAQSTAVVPSEAPVAVSDIYRLYLVLLHSTKPVVTGAFTKDGLKRMAKLLTVFTQGLEGLEKRPLAIFDCCPLSPLTWGDVATQNLVDCAELNIPAQIVPAPLMGATSPVTLIGTLIQTHAEVLAGIVISQLIRPGARIVYGGAPGVLDMRHATPSFAAVEASLVACSSAAIGKQSGLPTHAYLGGSDSKVLDAQAGLEASFGIMLAGMARINVVSGPGMLAALGCQSTEKLVTDNEICEMVGRLVSGVGESQIDEQVDVISDVGPGGDYLALKHTRSHLRSEHLFPSMLIDRLSQDAWEKLGGGSVIDRAKTHVEELLENYQRPSVCIDKEQELKQTFRDTLVGFEFDDSLL